MEQLKNFKKRIPDYVLDEVMYYFKKLSEGKRDLSTLNNAISLVNLAVVNDKISKEEGQILKEQIRNIKNEEVPTYFL